MESAYVAGYTYSGVIDCCLPALLFQNPGKPPDSEGRSSMAREFLLDFPIHASMYSETGRPASISDVVLDKVN